MHELSPVVAMRPARFRASDYPLLSFGSPKVKQDDSMRDVSAFFADSRDAREPVEHLIVASRGAWHLLVRAVKPAAATLSNRGRGKAWHRNSEGCNRCR